MVSRLTKSRALFITKVSQQGIVIAGSQRPSHAEGSTRYQGHHFCPLKPFDSKGLADILSRSLEGERSSKTAGRIRGSPEAPQGQEVGGFSMALEENRNETVC